MTFFLPVITFYNGRLSLLHSGAYHLFHPYSRAFGRCLKVIFTFPAKMSPSIHFPATQGYCLTDAQSGLLVRKILLK